MTEAEFTVFIKDGAEECFAQRGDVIPTIFFAAATPDGKKGIMAIPVGPLIVEDAQGVNVDKVGQLIAQIRVRSQRVAFVHLACQAEQGDEESKDVEVKRVVGILFYFGMRVVAHYAEILATTGKPILMNWTTTAVNGGRLAQPPPNWN